MIAGDNDTSDKLFAGINDSGEQLSPVTTTLAINLSPVLSVHHLYTYNECFM
jgi:hypothetical protein